MRLDNWLLHAVANLPTSFSCLVLFLLLLVSFENTKKRLSFWVWKSQTEVSPLLVTFTADSEDKHVKECEL